MSVLLQRAPPPIPSTMRMIQTLLLCSACLAVVACEQERVTTTAGGSLAGCRTRAYEEIGGPFTLTNHKGERVTEKDFMGRPALVYFGFTYCPDVCPSTLVSIANAYELLPEGMEPPQTLLITVDPERDTPAALAQYVSSNAFPDNLVGLTGSEAEVAKVADEFFVGFNKVETPESLAEYTMDHTSLLYLMDENWKLETFFAEANTSPDDMAICLSELLDTAS